MNSRLRYNIMYLLISVIALIFLVQGCFISNMRELCVAGNVLALTSALVSTVLEMISIFCGQKDGVTPIN